MKLSKEEKAIILEALLWMVDGETDGCKNEEANERFSKEIALIAKLVKNIHEII